MKTPVVPDRFAAISHRVWLLVAAALGDGYPRTSTAALAAQTFWKRLLICAVPFERVPGAAVVTVARLRTFWGDRTRFAPTSRWYAPPSSK
jgi:hypothetical protein